ncbi:MAG: hypothetical protein LBI84_06010 [Propionibacteriaceae bacterium]|nr:hypothetical protein [Propionibacteriaceae bacterium]
MRGRSQLALPLKAAVACPAAYGAALPDRMAAAELDALSRRLRGRRRQSVSRP